MNNLSLLPPPDTPWVLAKPVLNEAGLAGELLLLAPGAEHTPERPAPGGTLLFVITGSVTTRIGLAHHILQPETTLAVPAERSWALRNPGTAPARLLVISLPPPRVVDRPSLFVMPAG